MFDLDQSISSWRTEMSAGGACAGADLDELESHLRDSVARLSAAGLSPEESFLIAVRRLGRPDDLRPEYGKAHPERVWRDRAVWMLAGIVAWWGASAVGTLLGDIGTFSLAIAGMRGRLLLGTAMLANVLGLAAATALAVAVYRGVSEGRLYLRARTWVGLALLAIVGGRLVWQFGRAGVARLVAPTEFMSMYLASQYIDLVTGVLVPVAVAICALRLRAKVNAESC